MNYIVSYLTLGQWFSVYDMRDSYSMEMVQCVKICIFIDSSLLSPCDFTSHISCSNEHTTKGSDVYN